LPLLNYLRQFVEAAKAHEKTVTLQNEVSTIRLDAPKRAENAKIEGALAEDLRRNIQYLEDLNNRLLKSAEPFAGEDKRTQQAVQDYEQHKAQLRNTINEEYGSVQHYPRSIYTGV